MREDLTSPPPETGDDARLDALIARLADVEAGLREEVAAQAVRADDAEAALAAAEARAVRAEVAGRVTAPPAAAPSPASEAGDTPDAVEVLAAHPPTADGDREPLAAALREMRSYLERRRVLEEEVLAVAREAVTALGHRRGSSPA